MLKQPIYVEFNIDAKVNNSKLIAISHVDDKYSETLEVAVKQNDRFVYMGGASVVARMVLHREKDYLLSDTVPCTVNDNGNILIPFDNAVVKTRQGTVKIEVNITRDTDELTLQFPLWVSVNGSILDDAEVTPESEGTIPELLEEAKEALEAAQAALEQFDDYNSLENKPQISGVTLSGDKTPGELGLQKELTAGEHITIDASTGTISVFEVAGYKIVFESQNDRCTEDGTIYSTSIDGQPAVMFVRNSTTYITQFALVKGGKLIWRTQQAETSWQPAGEWSAWQEIGGGSEIASGIVNQNGTITFTLSDGSAITTTGTSVIGPQGPAGANGQDGADGVSPTATVTQTATGATITVTDANGTTTANIANGQDYNLTAQDKSDIAALVLAQLPTTQGVQYGN